MWFIPMVCRAQTVNARTKHLAALLVSYVYSATGQRLSLGRDAFTVQRHRRSLPQRARFSNVQLSHNRHEHYDSYAHCHQHAVLGGCLQTVQYAG